MKKILTALLILTLPAFTSSAIITESHRKAAEELLSAMDYDTTSKHMIESLIQMEIKQNPHIGLYEDTLRSFFTKYLWFKSLKSELIEIYTSELSEKDLKKIARFFNSDAGRKFSSKRAILFEKGTLVGQQRIQNNLGELGEMIQEETQRLKALQSSHAHQP